MHLRLALIAFFVLTSLSAQPPQGPGRGLQMQGPGARMAAQPIFNNNCASCHKNVKSSADPDALRENNAPSTDTLAQMSPETIYAALTTGAMVQQAANSAMTRSACSPNSSEAVRWGLPRWATSRT